MLLGALGVGAAAYAARERRLMCIDVFNGEGRCIDEGYQLLWTGSFVAALIVFGALVLVGGTLWVRGALGNRLGAIVRDVAAALLVGIGAVALYTGDFLS